MTNSSCYLSDQSSSCLMTRFGSQTEEVWLLFQISSFVTDPIDAAGPWKGQIYGTSGFREHRTWQHGTSMSELSLEKPYEVTPEDRRVVLHVPWSRSRTWFLTSDACELCDPVCTVLKNILFSRLLLPVLLIPASSTLTLGPDDNRTAAQETLLTVWDAVCLCTFNAAGMLSLLRSAPQHSRETTPS